MIRRIGIVVLPALLLALLPVAASPQQLLTDRSLDRSVSLEFLKINATLPYYDSTYGKFVQPDWTIHTGLWSLTCRLRVSPRVALVVEVPASLVPLAKKQQRAWVDDTDVVGNPYIGLELEDPGRFYSEAGVRLPVANSGGLARVLGHLADPYRALAVTDDVLSFEAAVHPVRRLERNNLVFDLGAALAVPTDGGDAELMANYGVHLELDSAPIWMWVGFQGQCLVTVDGSYADRTLHWLAVGARTRLGRLLPGLQVRVPLDVNYRSYADYIYGFSLQVDLGK